MWVAFDCVTEDFDIQKSLYVGDDDEMVEVIGRKALEVTWG